MKQLLEELVKSIVDHKDDVVIDEGSLEPGFVVLRLRVHSEDMGRVIGKEGKIIQALRTLLRVAALKQGKRVRIDLVESEPSEAANAELPPQDEPKANEPPAGES